MARQRVARGNPEAAASEPWPSSLALPDAREGGESAWVEWQEASRRLDLAFAPTEPSDAVPLTGAGDAVATPPRRHLLTVHSVMVVARHHNRACPDPAHWQELYELLGGAGQPGLQAPPLQPWLWPNLSGLQRRLRFREYVEWAERHGRLNDVARFVGALGEADWVHMGED